MQIERPLTSLSNTSFITQIESTAPASFSKESAGNDSVRPNPMSSHAAQSLTAHAARFVDFVPRSITGAVISQPPSCDNEQQQSSASSHLTPAQVEFADQALSHNMLPQPVPIGAERKSGLKSLQVGKHAPQVASQQTSATSVYAGPATTVPVCYTPIQNLAMKRHPYASASDHQLHHLGRLSIDSHDSAWSHGVSSESSMSGMPSVASPASTDRSSLAHLSRLRGDSIANSVNSSYHSATHSTSSSVRTHNLAGQVSYGLSQNSGFLSLDRKNASSHTSSASLARAHGRSDPLTILQLVQLEVAGYLDKDKVWPREHPLQPPIQEQVRFNKDFRAPSIVARPINDPSDPLPLSYPSIATPEWFHIAEHGQYLPNFERAWADFPFTELYRIGMPRHNGVLLIRDIPYQCTRQEILAFIGRTARVLHQPTSTPYTAIHIILERETGKTMDAFVEFATEQEMKWTLSSILKRKKGARGLIIGDRECKPQASSYEELMATLFPRAKNVKWAGPYPIVDPSRPEYYPGCPSEGFCGFLATEELAHLTKYTEYLNHNNFLREVPFRIFESIVSLLHKYPWYAPEHVLLLERRAIFDLAALAITSLIHELRSDSPAKNPHLTSSLLQELAVACLICPGFTERQKSVIVGMLCKAGYEEIAVGQGLQVQLGGGSELSARWPYQALSPHPGMEDKFVNYYGRLLGHAMEMRRLQGRGARRDSGCDGIAGHLTQWGVEYGEHALEMSLAQVAETERQAILELLAEIL